MRKKWWWLRLTLLSFAAVALGWYLFHSTPWRKALGIQPSYTAQIAEGDRLVLAIHAFHQRTDLWPQYLEDAYPEPTHFRWFYETQVSGEHGRIPSLSTAAPAEGSRAHLGYAFGSDAAHGDWHVFSGASDRIERAGAPAAAAAPKIRWEHSGWAWMMPVAVRESACISSPYFNTFIELDKRIAREPDRIEHRQDKISLLVLTDRIPEARAALAQAQADFPQSAWPRLAAAALDLPDGTTPIPAPATRPTSLQAIAEFAAAKPSFTCLFELSWLYRHAGDDNDAAQVATQAIRQPIEVDPDDTHIAAFYLWDLVRWALAQQRWALAISICDAWQKAREANAVRDESFFALRGAAELASKNFAAAQKDFAQSANADPAWIHAADAAIQALSAAAAHNDASVRLIIPPSTDNHPYPGDFAVFVAPQ